MEKLNQILDLILKGTETGMEKLPAVAEMLLNEAAGRAIADHVTWVVVPLILLAAASFSANKLFKWARAVARTDCEDFLFGWGVFATLIATVMFFIAVCNLPRMISTIASPRLAAIEQLQEIVRGSK